MFLYCILIDKNEPTNTCKEMYNVKIWNALLITKRRTMTLSCLNLINFALLGIFIISSHITFPYLDSLHLTPTP